MGTKHYKDELSARTDLPDYKKHRLRNPGWKEKSYLNHKQYIKNNPDKAKLYALRARLKRRGISEDHYNKLLILQNNLCAICGSDNKGASKDWAIDHCHTSNKIRGLLCQSCNLMIGFSRDNPLILSEAIKYLERNNGQ